MDAAAEVAGGSQRQRLCRSSKTAANQRLSQREASDDPSRDSESTSGSGGCDGGDRRTSGAGPSAPCGEASSSPSPPKSSQVSGTPGRPVYARTL